jgi:serine/threonine-protein kinase
MSTDGIISLQPGAFFQQRYQVVRRIKVGGMGAVYEVVDDRTNSPRALKIMLPSVLADADLRARFALEAKVTGNIVSDHLVRVADAGIDEPTGTPFLVMELLHGQELGSLLEQRRALPPSEAVLYLHQTALALDKTHAAGIVHRDLKPENLFVTLRDDGSPCLKILDFGIAKVVAQSTARLTRAVGTPIYMAPEQIRGDSTIGSRADLFALGHIAYALLVGEAYWHEELKSAEAVFPLLTKIMTGLPEPACVRARRRRGVALPQAFEAWFAKAIAARPEDRFDRATVQVAALADALGVAGPRAPQPSLTTFPLPDTRSGPVLAERGTVPLSDSRSGLPSSPGSGSGPQPVSPALGGGPLAASSASGSGAQPAVVSAPVAQPRSRSLLPLGVGALVVAALGAGGLVTLRSSTPPPATSVSTTEPPVLRSALPLVPAAPPEPTVAPEALAAPATTPTATPTSSASVKPPAAALPDRTAVHRKGLPPVPPPPPAAPTPLPTPPKPKSTASID